MATSLSLQECQSRLATIRCEGRGLDPASYCFRYGVEIDRLAARIRSLQRQALKTAVIDPPPPGTVLRHVTTGAAWTFVRVDKDGQVVASQPKWPKERFKPSAFNLNWPHIDAVP